MTEQKWDRLMETARLQAQILGERSRVIGTRSGRRGDGGWKYVLTVGRQS